MRTSSFEHIVRLQFNALMMIYGYPSYDLICRATNGDEKAVREILNFYNAYISKVCFRPCYHANGTVHMQVDEELKGEIHAEMMKAILKFEIRVK